MATNPYSAELAVGDGVRVDEDDLDVEHDEEHGDDVEADREALRRLAAGHDAALVRGVLGRRRPLRRQQVRHHQADRAEHDGQDQQHDDRQVLAHRDRSLTCDPWTGTALRLRGQHPLAAVQQPAQGTEDQPGAEGQHERRLAAGAEVADHVDVLVLAGVVDDRRRRGPAGLGARRLQRRHLDDDVVRLVPERQQVEVADLREAVATDVEDVDGLELAGREGARLLEEHAGGRRGLAEAGLLLGDRRPSPRRRTRSATSCGRLRERWRPRGSRRACRRPGRVQRVGVLQHGAPGHGVPRRLLAAQTDAVDRPDHAHQEHPAGETGQGHEEPEPGAEVGAEDEVDAAAQRAHGDDHDEDAAQLGLPPDGEQVGGQASSQAPHVLDDGRQLLVGQQLAEAGHPAAALRLRGVALRR